MKALALRFALFDAGNTLMHLDYAFIAEVLAAHGHPVEPHAVRVAEYEAKAFVDRALAPAARPEALLWRRGDGGRPSYFTTVLDALGVPRAAMPRVIEVLETHNRADCLWRVIEPDTTAVLGALRARGYALGVVSNADGRVEADLHRRGLGAYLTTVVDSSRVGVEKPDPAIFGHAVAALGGPPAAGVYVGDVYAIDVLGARSAGLHPILIDPLGRYPRATFDCPRIRGLGELLDLLPPRAAG